MQTELMFSVAASHASPTHLQENGSERKMNATYGQRCLEQYGRFNRGGLLAKTFPALLIGMEGWYSTRCRLTWKLKGTKYNRTYFQLAVSTLPTEGIGFGLLPTPTVAETIEPKEARKVFGNMRIKSNNGVEGQCKLTDLAMNGLLPTPTVNDMKNASLPPSQIDRNDSIVKRVLQDNPQAGKTSQLNPQFVAEMMGFPVDWTELPFLSGETKV